MTRGKIFLVVFVLILVLLFAWSTTNCMPFGSCPWGKHELQQKPKKVTITFVGAWDEQADWSDVITGFREYALAKRNLDVRIEYEKIDSLNYESILFDRQMNQEGPNIFMIFNSWLPKYEKRVVALPEGYMNAVQFEKAFPKVAYDDFVSEGKIYSLPMYVDTLALYYNKEIFRNNGFVSTPKNWGEFANFVEGMTKKDTTGKLQIMGAAIGGGEKVNRSQDIVILLVMQNNAKAVDRIANLYSFRTSESQKAVKYYTDFADPKNRAYTWDFDNQMYSVDAFVQGKAAMSLNYSYEIENIASKTGGTLDYGVALMPQQYDDKKINYASYWSPVVAKDAECVKESGITASCSDIAWDFLYFAAQAENAKYYLASTGRPAANLVLAKEQSEEVGSDLAPFASQVLTAESWDNSSNEKTDKALAEMIDSIVSTDASKKKSVESAVVNARNTILELNN